MKLRHVMIDLETMGTTPGSAIVSIGAVLFDPRVGKISKDTFYRELDWEGQNRIVDKDTHDWWYGPKVNDAAREALGGFDDLADVLGELADWLPKDAKVWGNGSCFDITILENAHYKLKMDIPWKFWNIRDCRTVLDMYESKRGGFNKSGNLAEAHNALGDALFQARYICKMWKDLLGGSK
jgi:hypothetical protein